MPNWVERKQGMGRGWEGGALECWQETVTRWAQMNNWGSREREEGLKRRWSYYSIFKGRSSSQATQCSTTIYYMADWARWGEIGDQSRFVGYNEEVHLWCWVIMACHGLTRSLARCIGLRRSVEGVCGAPFQQKKGAQNGTPGLQDMNCTWQWHLLLYQCI